MDQPKSTSRRGFLKTAAASAGAVAIPSLLAACSSGSSSKGAASSKGDDVLTIGLPVASSQFKATLAYLADFTKSTGITINPFTTNTPSGSWVQVFQQLSTRLAGGQPLNTAYIATEGMLLFEKQGLLDPLNSYIDKDKKEIDAYYADVDPQLLSNFRKLDDVDNKTYFLPIGYNVMGMWYNKSVFSQLKIPEPAPDWTWDDFASAASKIAQPPNRYGFAVGTPTPGPFTDVYPWVLTNGGAILNADQTKCVADSPENIEAATFVRNMVQKQWVNSPGGAYDPFTSASSGRLGMFGAGIWPNMNLTGPQSTINQQFAIVPWPKKTRSGTPVGVGGFPIFSSSKKKAALWQFIKYSISNEFEKGPVVPFGGDMPIRQSVARSQEFLSKYPPGTENFANELANSTMIVGVPNGSAVESAISTAWEQILTGAVSPAAGMQSMQAKCTQLMAQKI